MYLALRNAIEKFVHLTDAEWDLLFPYLEIRKLKKHELFAEVGKVAHDVGFVLDGMMRHYYIHDGTERTTYFYFENLWWLRISAASTNNLPCFPLKR